MKWNGLKPASSLFLSLAEGNERQKKVKDVLEDYGMDRSCP